MRNIPHWSTHEYIFDLHRKEQAIAIAGDVLLAAQAQFLQFEVCFSSRFAAEDVLAERGSQCLDLRTALRPVLKNGLDLLSHKEPLDQRLEKPTFGPVADGISHLSASIEEFKTMFVFPQRVRADELSVNEAIRWLPNANLRAPAHRNSVQMDAMVDDRPLLNSDRLWGQSLKP